jgi:dihydrodiol dehydrogenase / D-xylose 1-dehydrogenase (NADP)
MTNTILDHTLPPPLDDPTCTDPLQCPPLRWGMIGCGRVSHDYTQALKHIPTAQVVACSTQNDIERATDFATKHKIDKAYCNYDELLKDENVDIVYIGNVHSFRRSIVEKCLMANKHTLVEKPFACTLEDAEYLIQLAKERNLFMIEGMWTRYFPIVEKVRQLVYGRSNPADGTLMEKGVLGEVVHVISDFNFNASDSEIYPTSFFYNRKLGGGASLLTGPYPIAASSTFHDWE